MLGSFSAQADVEDFPEAPLCGSSTGVFLEAD